MANFQLNFHNYARLPDEFKCINYSCDLKMEIKILKSSRDMIVNINNLHARKDNKTCVFMFQKIKFFYFLHLSEKHLEIFLLTTCNYSWN